MINRDATDPRAGTLSAERLPIVDLTPLAGSDAQARAALVAGLRAACTGHGFFYLVNHGVPTALMAAVQRQAGCLFALDDAAKQSIAASHPSGLGYGRMGGKALSGNHGAQVKEEYYWAREGVPGLADHNRWPAELAGFREPLEAYREALYDLAERLMMLLAETLELPADTFSGFCHDALATVRLVRYPPEGAEAGMHTDFGALTILLLDGAGGLQVLDRASGGWMRVDPLDGSFVVNLGDLFEIWTNRLYRSTPHRVVHAPGRARISVPFFYSGAADHVVECLPQFADRGPPPAPITPAGHLRASHEAQGF